MLWQNFFRGSFPEQEEHSAAVINDLIQIVTNEPNFFKKVITGDGLWVCGYDPEMKPQLSQWKSPGNVAAR